MHAIHTTSAEFKKKKITLADYLLMPELNYPYEIINGEMMPSPAPTPAHQIIGANIFSPLSQYVKTKELGVVLFAPVDIILQRDPLRTRQPDVLFIHKDNLPGTSLDDLEELQLLEITPDFGHRSAFTLGYKKGVNRKIDRLSTDRRQRVLAGQSGNPFG